MHRSSYFSLITSIVFLLVCWPTKLIAEPNPEITWATINELMARPKEFDGVKVRVIAVADFDFSFEAIPHLYSSKEDWKHWTNNRIELEGEFEGKASRLGRSKMEQMNGEYVILEGIFKYWSRENLKIEGVGFRSCWHRCRHYWIEKITRVDEWKSIRKTH